MSSLLQRIFDYVYVGEPIYRYDDRPTPSQYQRRRKRSLESRISDAPRDIPCEFTWKILELALSDTCPSRICVCVP
jgi:hypothetical protein